MSLQAKRLIPATLLAGAMLLAVNATGCQDIICLADPDEEHLCQPRGDIFEAELDVFGPVAHAQGVAYRVPSANRITLLKTEGSTAAIEHVTVPQGPSLLRVSPDANRLMSLSPTTQTLTVFSVDATGDQTIYPLGSPFESLSFSDDGQYAIAFAAGAGDGSSIIQNNNELAVIDLTSEPHESEGPDDPQANNPQLIALRSFGSTPSSVVFAPPFTIEGQERRVALVLSENYVTILELNGFDKENPNSNETVVRFVQDNDSRVLRTKQILWTEDDPTVDDDTFAFLLTDGSDDIISLNLLPGTELDSLDRPKIRPSLNQLTGGRNPVSIELFETGAGEKKLLAVNRGSNDLAVIDVATSDTTIVPLEAAVESVITYKAINPDTGREENFALLFSNARTVLFVELETVEVRRTRAIERLNLDQAVGSLTLTPDPNRALILHAGKSAFSILNLERRFVTPLNLSSQISDVAFADGENLLTLLQGEPFVSLIELRNGHPTSVRLDLPAEKMAVVPSTNSLVIDHGGRLGSVTLMPLNDLSREAAQTLSGFGADALFDITD